MSNKTYDILEMDCVICIAGFWGVIFRTVNHLGAPLW